MSRDYKSEWMHGFRDKLWHLLRSLFMTPNSDSSTNSQSNVVLAALLDPKIFTLVNTTPGSLPPRQTTKRHGAPVGGHSYFIMDEARFHTQTRTHSTHFPLLATRHSVNHQTDVNNCSLCNPCASHIFMRPLRGGLA